MSNRWERIGFLFEQAVALPTTARAPFIEQSGEPDDIKSDVRSLIDAHERAGEFMVQPAAADHPGAVEAAAADFIALPPPLEPGHSIGAYRIVRLVGRGGMGVVYEALDTRLNRRVAVKCLSPDLAGEERQRQRLRQEARAAALLSHPGIAMVFALEEVDDQVYIVSEFLDGETLRAEITRGRSTPKAAAATALAIAQALCAAHERGIVHRDLKPENVMRTGEGALKVLDFGLALFDEGVHEGLSRTRWTQTGMVAGTPPYMSPEQLLGRETDFRADHFALGVMLYELTTGRHPFGGRSMPSVIAHILATDPPPAQPSVLPLPHWAVIQRCLQKDPAARFPSSRDLVAALQDLAAASATPRKPDVTTQRRAPRTPAVLPHRTAPPAPDAPPHRTTPHQPGAPAVPVAPDVPLSSAMWWWRFHQIAISIAYSAMVVPAWTLRGPLGRGGLAFFFSLLAAAVVAVTLRLHLVFSARVYPEDLPAQLEDLRRWLRAADLTFASLLVVAGVTLSADHAAWSALLVAVGVGSAVAFLVIEPATTRAAFRPRED
ncbi:MAG: serine/threonine-protein kinase [Acidobacteriota bacterium]